ncbi:MAG: NifB/NifX family molybdenum-iron cluster-binding protein [Spirochaetales bacterium]|nr:NifB/NifX family molybdenum-iron cluster-binding protein [Spirochaetales bacterium]
MKRIFAVPTEKKKACAHFGHCESFAIIKTENGAITQESYVDPPEHQPGTYPRFLVGFDVDTVLAGGMGEKAQSLFRQNNIEVIMGAGTVDPSSLVEEYLSGQLKTSTNLCDH